MLPDYDVSRETFQKYDILLTENIYKKLDIYAQFLVEYNKNVNLTAITKPDEILVKHFLDSIYVAKFVSFVDGASLIDVGTGAGFPSIPLKIFYPQIKITLLDSLNKRITFLMKLCDKLEIEADFICDRAENASKMAQYREKFDFACARAVAGMSRLSEFCLPFVRINGYFFALKGPNEQISEAKNAVKILGGEIISENDYRIENENRKLILVKKISQISPKYPRNSGQIKKNPL